MMKRLEATIYGRVQGVFFRETTQQMAQQLRLFGWVANQADGSVQVMAEGAEEKLHKLVTFLHQGPAAARVDKVDVIWGEPAGEWSEFSVRWL